MKRLHDLVLANYGEWDGKLTKFVMKNPIESGFYIIHLHSPTYGGTWTSTMLVDAKEQGFQASNPMTFDTADNANVTLFVSHESDGSLKINLDGALDYIGDKLVLKMYKAI